MKKFFFVVTLTVKKKIDRYAGLAFFSLITFIFPLRADVLPPPPVAETAFELKEEAVSISIAKEVAHVEALFLLEIGTEEKNLKPLQYCHPNPPPGGISCSEPYYSFDFLYPILTKQNLKNFKVVQDGIELMTLLDKSNKELLEKFRDIGSWYRWQSPEIKAKEWHLPYQTRIKVSYSEPLRFRDGKATLAYVLRTGATWKGSIGKAIMSAQANDAGLSLQSPSYLQNRKESWKGKIVWEWSSFEPEKDVIITIQRK